MLSLLPRIFVSLGFFALIGVIAIFGKEPLSLLVVFFLPAILDSIPVFPPSEYAAMTLQQGAPTSVGEYDGGDDFIGFAPD